MQVGNMNTVQRNSGVVNPSGLAAPRKFGMAPTARQLKSSPLAPLKPAMPSRRSGKTYELNFACRVIANSS
jgi:hypothetical protein